MIIERGEENISEFSNIGLPDALQRQRAEEIMNYYLTYYQDSNETAKN